MDFTLLFLQYLIIVTILFALVFTLGVIWRTEKKLDVTYKLFFVALLGFLGARILSLGFFSDEYTKALVILILDFVGVFFLLLSILEMRVIVRILSNETRNKK
jgi:uncharacterized membrane protein YhfC